MTDIASLREVTVVASRIYEEVVKLQADGEKAYTSFEYYLLRLLAFQTFYLNELLKEKYGMRSIFTGQPIPSYPELERKRLEYFG